MRVNLASLVTIASWTVSAVAKDLTATLQGNANTTEYIALLKSYGQFYANISFQDGLTLLVPNNDAFNKIPYSVLGPAFKANDSGVVMSVLQYHVLQGLHPANSFNGSYSFPKSWLQNQTYTNVTGGQVVGGVRQSGNVNIFSSGVGERSTLTQPDIQWDGGLIHVIDTFLVPPLDFEATCPQFNLTAAGGAFAKADLENFTDTATDLTIFAPSNDAFQNIGTTLADMSTSDLAKLLNYHVVNGSNFIGYSSSLPNGTVLQTREGANLTITFESNSLFVNQARMLQQDILISNGVMHVIDNFLDYNASKAEPNPELATAPPLITGTSMSGNVIPYTEFLPTSVTSYTTGASGSFGVSDIGANKTSTSAIGASSTFGGVEATHKKKGDAARADTQTGGTGVVLGFLLFVIGLL